MNAADKAASAVLELTGLRIATTGATPRTIVHDMNLSVAAGETVAVVGESGSGKSMTAKAVVDLLPDGVAATGSIRYLGEELLGASSSRLGALRGREIALMFQDPFTMLNPLRRIGDQLTDGLDVDGGRRGRRDLRRAAAARRLAEVGLDPLVAGSYPFQLSGGMRQRVGLAAALAGNPKVLIADEPSTALDVTTQEEILRLITSLQAARAMGVILITHDLQVALSTADRVYVMYAGSPVEVADAAALAECPRHPYTQGLLLSEPPADRRMERLAPIEGAVPRPDDVATCCSFAARCAWAAPACHGARPRLEVVEPGRASACVRRDEIAAEMTAVRRRAQAPAALHTPDRGEVLASVRDLRKIFPRAHGGGGQVTALGGVSIEIPRGMSVGLVGESGSGKTTLGRCLVGLERPTSGEVWIDGVQAADFGALPADERRRVRRAVQVIFQDPHSTLNPVRTVGATLGEALALYRDLRGRRERDAAVEALLERVGLPGAYRQRKPAMLSGGERQRVAIARALATEPKLIVCDEPVSALDVSVQAQILNLFRDLQRDLGLSYLFVTHDLAVVRQIADWVYVLYRGEVVESGPVHDTLDQPQHAYTTRLLQSRPTASREPATATR